MWSPQLARHRLPETIDWSFALRISLQDVFKHTFLIEFPDFSVIPNPSSKNTLTRDIFHRDSRGLVLRIFFSRGP